MKMKFKIKQLFYKLKLRFTKHQYEYSHKITLTGVGITYPVDQCKNCGHRVSLLRKDRDNLPRSDKYGCSGKRKPIFPKGYFSPKEIRKRKLIQSLIRGKRAN